MQYTLEELKDSLAPRSAKAIRKMAEADGVTLPLNSFDKEHLIECYYAALQEREAARIRPNIPAPSVEVDASVPSSSAPTDGPRILIRHRTPAARRMRAGHSFTRIYQ